MDSLAEDIARAVVERGRAARVKSEKRMVDMGLEIDGDMAKTGGLFCCLVEVLLKLERSVSLYKVHQVARSLLRK